MENKIVENNENEVKRELKRGDIYWVDFPEDKSSKIQGGVRPAILIVNDQAGRFAPVIQCIPITTKIKRTELPVHVVLNSGDLQRASMLLGEQLHAVDTYRILDKIGRVSDDDMYQVDLATINQLGINLYSVMSKMAGVNILSVINRIKRQKVA
jgi:mRNA interferase MazF